MMAFTHLLASLAIGVLVAPVVSGTAGLPLVVATAVIGGLAPDVDLLAHHRRTLHYPIGSPVAALAAGGLFVATGWVALLLAALLFGAAALHVLLDLAAGSAERTPWNPVTEFGVYNHLLGHWHRPRRVVGYSGSPGDFACSGGLAVVVLAAPATTPTLNLFVVGTVALAGGYCLARRRLGGLTRRLPAPVRQLVPVIIVEECDDGGTTVVVRRNQEPTQE